MFSQEQINTNSVVALHYGPILTKILLFPMNACRKSNNQTMKSWMHHLFFVQSLILLSDKTEPSRKLMPPTGVPTLIWSFVI